MTDILSPLLRSFALRANVFFHSSFSGSWTLDTSGEHKATFHVISRGLCWLHLPDKAEPVALQGGDLVVFPHDAPHTIANAPVLDRSDNYQTSTENEGPSGPSTSFICGYFEFDQNSWNPLLDALPEVIIIKGAEATHTALMESLMRLIISEAESNLLGMELVIDRLCDVLFIHVARTCLNRKEYQQGFLRALADQQISKALQQVHEHPELNWSVQSLAGQAGMSRSAFAEKFGRLVGVSAMHYVTQWRMMYAYSLLSKTREPMATIAEKCGYSNEAAFSKAFKRIYAKGPGLVRRESSQH